MEFPKNQRKEIPVDFRVFQLWGVNDLEKWLVYAIRREYLYTL